MNRIHMTSREKGLTLIEVLVGLGILSVLIFASLSLTSSALTTTRLNLDKQFATEKAISILEELKSLAQNTTGGNIVVLDTYDDGLVNKPELTIQNGAVPDDPISGNMQGPLGWLYERHITVQRIGGQTSAGVRLVRVGVYRQDATGQRLIAEVSSVIRTLATVMPQTQVYDVYCIAIENVPGWWVYTAQLVPFVQNAINELQARNSGLEYRIHWITELAYGRDQEYRPYLNNAAASTADINYAYFYPGTLPVGASNPPALTQYYPTQSFNAHVNIDGVDANSPDAAGGNAVVRIPYTLADQYNHAMRYYDEVALWNQRQAAGYETEPTYRLLLDDMQLNPTKYTNAILINLHGELFPFPPIRNFSDPAKNPEQIAAPDLRNVRVVTHPENIEYLNANPITTLPTSVKLRVYAYEAPSGTSANAIMPVPITVLIKNVDLTGAGTMTIQAIEGGIAGQTTQSGNLGYAKQTAATTASGNRMYATTAAVANGTGSNDTLITLYNTPVRAPECLAGACGAGFDGTGLSSSFYLYSQQYIPSPLENFANTAAVTEFTKDLTTVTSPATPKNTARWIITLVGAQLNTVLNASGVPAFGGVPDCPAPCTNSVLTVETRMGTPPIGGIPTTGVLYPARNQPTNLSRTYVWRGTSLWLFGDGTDANPPHLPITERYQFIGDPRHDPYADNKRPHVTGTFRTAGVADNESRIGMGYNRYFDDFEAAANAYANWPGWAYIIAGVPNQYFGIKNVSATGVANVGDDGWTPISGASGPFGQLEIDIPRAFQILRTSLTYSRSIYTTMTGWSYYYVGIGGEIGYDDANQFPNSVPLSTKPFTGASGATTEQSITNDVGWGSPASCLMAQGCGVKYVRQNGAAGNYWWAMHWLGELYPDRLQATDFYRTTFRIMPGAVTAAAGNLSAGVNVNDFKRVLRGQIAPASGLIQTFTLPAGTDFLGGTAAAGGPNAVRRTLGQGSVSFFWTGTSTNTFHHTSQNGNGNLISKGLDIASATAGYNFPLLNPIPANRPFDFGINSTGDNPEYFLSSAYGPAFLTKEEAELYRHSVSTTPASALDSLRDPSSNKVAFIVVNGLSPTGAAGSSFIARWSFLSLMHSYFQAGLYTDNPAPVGPCAQCPYRVKQVPRVSITFPSITDDLNNVSNIDITWSLVWKRWDGKSYTPDYAAGFTETEPVSYQVMYSDDNGITWKWCDTTLPGTPSPGTKTAAALITATDYNWSTPSASFPMGNYLIRVEAYRTNFNLHYSYHQFRAFIRR